MFPESHKLYLRYIMIQFILIYLVKGDEIVHHREVNGGMNLKSNFSFTYAGYYIINIYKQTWNKICCVRRSISEHGTNYAHAQSEKINAFWSKYYFLMFVSYCNPGHDGSHNECLRESMAGVQSVDEKIVFVFICDVNEKKERKRNNVYSNLKKKWYYNVYILELKLSMNHSA